MFTSIGNLAMPAAAVIILISTFSYWSNVTFAIAVECNGQKLGYIKDESVYLTAQEMVKDRIDTLSQEAQNVLGTPKYTVALVRQNELTDAKTISDKIVENSQGDIISACGIYINDEFICAIKNETDAMQLFSGLLEKGRSDDPNTVVGFVEDVRYVEGLYPDNDETIWDTDKLLKTLQGTKTEASYYTVKDGDTPSGIANITDSSLSELYQLNPGLEDSSIKAGDKILVSNEVNYLRVKVVKTEVSEEDIPYETIKTDNANLAKGTEKVKQAGVTGTSKVTRLVTYIQGVKVSVEEIDRVTLREPRSELIDVGTKRVYNGNGGGGKGGNSRPVSGNYGSKPTSGKLVWPIIGLYKVSSPYGYRRGGFHGGIDLSGPNASGHIVVAAASGKVTAAGWGGAYGYRVIIDHGGGMQTLYAHCLSGSVSVGVGRYVNAGDAIARVGSTGNSTGPHLHFEVRINGNRVNPAPYLGLS
jgi:murein DD-endopeptidase MepM/ murein hydrolase activator NlpD